MAKWYVYMVRCSNGTLYTGIATDVRRRIMEHEQTDGKGAKCLRGKGPFELVLARAIATRSLALRVECQIKKLTKAQKEQIIARKSRLTHIIKAVSRCILAHFLPEVRLP